MKSSNHEKAVLDFREKKLEKAFVETVVAGEIERVVFNLISRGEGWETKRKHQNVLQQDAESPCLCLTLTLV